MVVYHVTEPHPSSPLIRGEVHNVSPISLQEQLERLQKHFDLTHVDELADRLKRGRRVDGLAAVTFDDGYRSVIEHAAPLLEALEIPSTFFISTKVLNGGTSWRDKVRLVENEGLRDTFLEFARGRDPAFNCLKSARFYRDSKNPAKISSDLVERMLDEFLTQEGVSIEQISDGAYCTLADLKRMPFQYMKLGNHTVNHYVLSSLTRTKQHDEIEGATSCLSGVNAEVSKIFSIPFGAARDFNATTLEILRDLGYVGFVQSSGYQVTDGRERVVPNRYGLVGLNRFMPRPDARCVWAEAG